MWSDTKFGGSKGKVFLSVGQAPRCIHHPSGPETRQSAFRQTSTQFGQIVFFHKSDDIDIIEPRGVSKAKFIPVRSDVGL